jgi:hypothetical protein
MTNTYQRISLAMSYTVELAHTPALQLQDRFYEILPQLDRVRARLQRFHRLPSLPRMPPSWYKKYMNPKHRILESHPQKPVKGTARREY